MHRIFTFIRRWRAASALFVVLFVGACDISVAGTSVVMFPTAAPPGTRLPTFNPGGGGGGLVPTVPPGFPTQPPIVFPTATRPPVVFPSPTFPIFVPTQPPVIVPTRPPATLPPPVLDEAGWIALTNGVQWRTLTYRNSQGLDVAVIVVRGDPTLINLRVYYQQGRVGTIQQWQGALPRAYAIINANFYDPQNRPLGLVATDGVLYGSAALRPSARDDGMFQVQNNVASVRSMFLKPFNPQERFQQAAQAFPMLMAGGFVAPINPDVASVVDRRTVVAQDKRGRILFIVTPFSRTSLGDLANWLGRSGLELDMALNLDGGSSTCMYIATGGAFQYTSGLKPVPVVIAMMPK